MICKVCKQDHSNQLDKWCDRSISEIKIDYLELKIDKLREALLRIKVRVENVYCEADINRVRELVNNALENK